MIARALTRVIALDPNLLRAIVRCLKGFKFHFDDGATKMIFSRLVKRDESRLVRHKRDVLGLSNRAAQISRIRLQSFGDIPSTCSQRNREGCSVAPCSEIQFIFPSCQLQVQGCIATGMC